MKDKYRDTLVDLVFDDDTVLTIAGSVDLPYSIELVSKVILSSLFSLRLSILFLSFVNTVILLQKTNLTSYLNIPWI